MRQGLLALCLLLPAVARADAKWTEIIIAQGAYADMRANLQATGATDDVNILVWHNPMAGGPPLQLYRLEKDTVAGHPPGECCPVDGGPCCGSADIDPADLGVTDISFNKENLVRLLAYARETMPSEHYLLVFRGVPYTNSEFSVPGFSIMDLAEVLRDFQTARGGAKLEVLVLAFCLCGNTDWSYAFKDMVEYFVGPPNYTNPPVTARWRVHRWARTLARDPEQSPRSLATEIVNIFTDTTAVCVSQGHGCSNLVYGEPWTVGAADLSRADDYARALRYVVCAYLPQYNATAYNNVYGQTTQYGSITGSRLDLRHFAMNLRAATSDARLRAAIDDFLAAHDAYIFAHAVEPTGFGEQSYGLSAFFENGYSVPDKIGPFMYASLWKALLRKIESGSNLPVGTGIAIDPGATRVPIGADLLVPAVDTHPTYGLMCPAGGVTWSVSDPGIATLTNPSANPVTVRGVAEGSVVLTVDKGGYTDSVTLTVTPGLDAGLPGDDGGSGGCDCRAARRAPAPVGAVLLLLAGLIGLGARPRRRR